MGADMIAATLLAPKDFTPDWDAGRQAIKDLDLSTVEGFVLDDLYNEYEFDGLTDQDQWDPKITLEVKVLHFLEQRLPGRDVTWNTYGELTIFIAGGLSWGDAPEVAREMWTLQEFPTVLKAIGFIDGSDIVIKSKENA